MLPSRRLSAVSLDGAELFVALIRGSEVHVLALHRVLLGQDEPLAVWQTPDNQLIEQVSCTSSTAGAFAPDLHGHTTSCRLSEAATLLKTFASIPLQSC